MESESVAAMLLGRCLSSTDQPDGKRFALFVAVAVVVFLIVVVTLSWCLFRDDGTKFDFTGFQRDDGDKDTQVDEEDEQNLAPVVMPNRSFKRNDNKIRQSSRLKMSSIMEHAIAPQQEAEDIQRASSNDTGETSKDDSDEDGDEDNGFIPMVQQTSIVHQAPEQYEDEIMSMDSDISERGRFESDDEDEIDSQEGRLGAARHLADLMLVTSSSEDTGDTGSTDVTSNVTGSVDGSCFSSSRVKAPIFLEVPTGSSIVSELPKKWWEMDFFGSKEDIRKVAQSPLQASVFESEFNRRENRRSQLEQLEYPDDEV